MPRSGVYSLYEDSKGFLWIGTEGGGVSVFDGEKFKTFTTEDGLAFNIVRVVFEDEQGNMWFGTRTGISKFDGNTFRNFTEDEGLSNSRIRSIILDSLGNLWIGTFFGGINKYSGEDFVHYTENDGIINNQILSLNSDSEGNIWLGTFEGVSRMSFENGVLENVLNITEDEGLANSVVRSLHRDNAGNIREKFISPEVEDLNASSISSIIGDIQGNVWIATEGNGIFAYENKSTEILASSFKKYTIEQGLTSNYVYLLIFDDEGNLWAGTEKGIDKIYSDFSGLKHYGREEGFTGIETYEKAAYKDDSGKIWFGIIKGVTCYDPFASQINKKEAYTHITGIHIFSGGVELDPAPYSKSMSGWFHLPEDLILPHNKNNLSLDFIGISLKIPSKVQYSWKLEGFEDEWSPPSSKHDVSYTNLPSGGYTFLIKASNDDGVWNEEASAFSFRISRPFWKTLWFGLCCVITGFGFFILYTKIRERKLIREKRILTEKVEQRTAEIQKQKEELAAEKEKSDELLLNILPREAADELKLRGKASTKYYEQVSVLFTDFVGFTKVTEQVSHEKLISEMESGGEVGKVNISGSRF